MSRFHLAALLTLLTTAAVAATEPPRLVVQIVVGSLQAGDIERYGEVIGNDGLGEFPATGFSFTNSHYDFGQTTTPATLATLATGARPSMHGVVGSCWYDYITNQKVELIHDSAVSNIEYNLNNYGFSPHRLVAPTLAESLVEHNAKSRTATISVEPTAAIVLNGKGGNCFWIDEESCAWASSTAFYHTLPSWIKKYNSSGLLAKYLDSPWTRLHAQHRYLTEPADEVENYNERTTRYFDDKMIISEANLSHAERKKRLYERLSANPSGNRALFEFAKEVVANLHLGGDEATDMLNIYLSTSKKITERHGTRSIEVEDMLYHLDADIYDFLNFVRVQVKDENVLFVLTSDHGSSPTTASGEDKRFRSSQFCVILNSYLKARHGEGEWVLGYANGCIYLNHDTILEHNLELERVREQVATFAVEFKGVSHALTANALMSSYFSSGYGAMMQNSYYQRRSGDVMINLMPGWIELSEGGEISTSGSMYRYDTDVPLILMGAGVKNGSSNERISMSALAPTIAHLCQMRVPAVSEAIWLEQIVKTE